VSDGAREANAAIERDRLKYAERVRSGREHAMLDKLDRMIELLEKIEERTRPPSEHQK